jgi:E3 ubiquitin-protein ligase RGLG
MMIKTIVASLVALIIAYIVVRIVRHRRASKVRKGSSYSIRGFLSALFGLKKRRRKIGLRGEEHASVIKKQYESLEEVQEALQRAGLESSQLIIGIDYTKSNIYTGKRTFYGRSLHSIDVVGEVLNPYQSVIQLIGHTLEPFDQDKVIPTFGFGDMTTTNQRVFQFSGCHGKPSPIGVDEVLQRYNEITPTLNLAGPTNFAPLIYRAIEIVKASQCFHILLIVADGQVTNEDETIQAIVDASNYPLVIIMVGVGDGPWEMMEDFDDRLPDRAFDNFQFVNYHRTVGQLSADSCLQDQNSADILFTLDALGELPTQYKHILRLNLLPQAAP